MNCQYFLYSLLIIISATSLAAQDEIIGYVVDEEGQPLVFATIALYKNGVLRSGIATDQWGEFIVKETDFDMITVSYLGNGQKTLTKAEIAANNWVILGEQSIELQEIVVSAYNPRVVHSSTSCSCTNLVSNNAEINLTLKVPRFRVSYSPNPTRDYVNIRFPDGITGMVEVINELGAVLDRVDITAPLLQIDITRFPAGTYFLRHLDEPLVYQLGTVIKVD